MPSQAPSSQAPSSQAPSSQPQAGQASLSPGQGSLSPGQGSLSPSQASPSQRLPGQASPSPEAALPPRRRAPASSAGGWAVETHGLTKRFGATVAVDDVELLVPRGSAFGYLGPNGAGKTTLIRTLLGLTKANGGTTSLLGTPVPAERSKALARIGAIVDEPRFHAHLTGQENLRLLAAARGGEASQRIAPSLARVGLTGRANDKVASYSMGMRQRLGVAACLLSDPELLILDEPMNGLDPAGMHEMRAMITSLADEGRTVVLSSHLLDEIERTCDTVAIVDHGRVIRQGSIDELTRGAGGGIVQVDCADPDRAAQLITEAGIAAGTSRTEAVLTVTLPAGAGREVIADLNRRLVNAGIDVYGLREVQTSLEDWFLSVTSRLGEP
jgi:ABC-2 type transport system ATP-binding protein